MRTQAGYFFPSMAMKYQKPPLSIDEQLDLLASRGMEIPDRARATRYFTHINYYRLRAYWLPFEAPCGNGDHRFRQGTRFDDALRHYLFDRKFRLLVLEAIERIEVSFRSRFAYVLSMKYGSHAHLDVSRFRSPDNHRKCLEDLKREVDRSQETFIGHYRTCYSDPESPPIWAACEVMSFGLLSKWYGNILLRQDRNAIADVYGLDEQIFGSVMHHLTPVRNMAAHHSRLWNRRLTIMMRLPSNPPDLRRQFSSASGRNMYNTLVMLGYLLMRISPGTSWVSRVKTLMAEYPQVDSGAMGFPTRWREYPLWS